MKVRISTFFIFVSAILFLNSCTLEKAIDYSFYVSAHGEYEINNHCFGIDDEPGERLLITDCGGYLNVITSTLTLGLLTSSENTTNTYRAATEYYLDSKYESCNIKNLHDYGGRLFEIFYRCESLENN